VKKILLVGAVLAIFYYLNREPAEIRHSPDATRDAPAADVFDSRSSGTLVSGKGRVTRVLGDDSLGDRHQRFILELDSGQTILVAHNIDLAPRIEALREGDLVEFSGEYEWNDKGGIVHWTHHDPQGQHPGGWLRHEGRTYE
jgi:hypothetical protein